ncbi:MULTISPECIES: hypothetical protein [unclassified Leptolyngbya]|uniref:hypothetical protein n=1 Tax=unclassified Leptolyngbya TaxID=2650499 RepID=UPI001689EA42|nr:MULTISPECIES: hypothetical protein [unclassified Leptolyngbya]MBD1914023.1 hypothetical protein [Leptolyngbya sp. FACHB-8]MBD2154022.1 hypothetical protein [Leptolyngbya sp. FACHB-16]
MFLAEFSFNGTAELADELLIQATSELDARRFAEEHASTLGLDLFSFASATQQQIWLYQTLHKFIRLESSQEETKSAESVSSEQPVAQA